MNRSLSLEASESPGHPIGRAASARGPSSPAAAPADLNEFLHARRSLAERGLTAPRLETALALHRAVVEHAAADPRSVDARILTDAEILSEYDRDQNVYLGRFFTRFLTRATPDLVFLPVSAAEAAAALAWARGQAVPVTLRGAGSTAMGGSVPADGGLVLDVARLDEIAFDERERAVVLGAGARFRRVHAHLAERGYALPAYPSNLGGTYAGWLVTGGIGLNAFGGGRAEDAVLWIECLLPSGDAARWHRDGRFFAWEGGAWQEHAASEAEAWFAARDLPVVRFDDWPGSEGQLGLVTRLAVGAVARRQIVPFLLAFETEAAAHEFVGWVRKWSPSAFPLPANLKWLSATHLHHARRAWADDDARAWRARPSRLSDGSDLPWRALLDPGDWLRGVPLANREDEVGDEDRAFVYLDFAAPEGARAFAQAIGRAPGRFRLLPGESLRFSAERFRPQSVKRLGPGLLAAEVLLPAGEVAAYLAAARRLAGGAGASLDVEVYHLTGDRALVLAAYLTDHRRGGFALRLPLAPVLTELALSAHRGRPYVLGRWQGAFFARATDARRAARWREIKRAADAAWIVNRGSFFAMGLRGPAGRVVESTFLPGVRLVGGFFASALARPLVWLARAALAVAGGPARGRGRTAGETPPAAGGRFDSRQAVDRALTCVNCGECNSVCPIFHHSGIRLPQMLTHVGEELAGGRPPGPAGAALLDLCMRCGNCEEVCQAGIPHLPLYGAMQQASDAIRPRDAARHDEILETLRAAGSYRDGFLRLRSGGYKTRAAASLPGLVRFVLQRAENDDGPAATCIHCAACVPVCPTGASRVLQESDRRLITTDQARCIGCGTCVEVCPANHMNGGQTLRVVEAPTLAWVQLVRDLTGGRETATEARP